MPPAIEDFPEEKHHSGHEFGFAEMPAMSGLSALFDLDTDWSRAGVESITLYSGNKLLVSLE